MDDTITVNINNLTQKERNQPISKSKKKRKFRVMTNAEFCDKHKYCSTCPKCKDNISGCCWLMHECTGTAPYRTSNGKYILVEVINDA